MPAQPEVQYGWDTSHYDYARGPVDLAAAVADGVSFATAKATEGRGYVDPRYATTAARARGVVPLFGAYHVLHPDGVSPLGDQVNHFLLVLNVQSPWWRTGPWLVQLDCERWAANDFPSAVDIQTWCDLFRGRTSGAYTPIVYASRGQYGDSLAGVDCPLWNADFGANPAVHYRDRYAGDAWHGWTPYSGKTAAVGQYGSKLTIGGQAGCDANAFRGSLDELIALTQGGTMGANEAAYNASANAWAIRMGVETSVFPGDAPGQRTPQGNPLWELLREIKTAVDEPAAPSDAALDRLAQKIAALLPPLTAAPSAADIAEELARRLGNG